MDRRDGRRTAIDVYDTLQASILDGKLQPGTILSQVGVAQALNVSRTPVREAMRKLQENGLLEGEPNYRSRVVGFDPQDIEALYLRRITLETLGVMITTKRLTPALLAEIRATIEGLESDRAHGDFEYWRDLHRRLHALVVSEAGDSLINELRDLELRSARYQAARKGADVPGWWQRGEAEHRGLYDAIVSGNAAMAGELAGRHLARTVLELLAAMAPEYDTSRVRDGLRFAIGGAQAAAAN